MPTQTDKDVSAQSFIAPVTGDQMEHIHQEPPVTKPKSTAMKKKGAIIGGIVLLLVLIIGGIVAALTLNNGSKTAAPTPTPAKRRVVEPTNIIPVDQRPVVYIIPKADGRNLTLRVESVKKAATSAEYELEYQAGELLQGVNGALDLATLPAETTQLMGSCSAGGKCSYHENVKGGSLLLRFIGAENYALKQDWKYIDNLAKETAISSKDAKFQLDSQILAKVRYMVIYNSPGFPEGVSGIVVSDPYALQASSQLIGKGRLTMRANEEGTLAIAGYDGKAWKEYTGTVDGKMITADVDVLPLYVVVSK